jgi:membrane-associated phospholipid phosphatase
VLAAALLAAVAVEVVCKELLVRPRLHQGSFHIVAFNSSFPSGHTLRTVIVAAAVAWAWPRLRAAAVVWAVAGIVLLELAGWHTPTDVLGGLLLGLLALLGARAAGALRARGLPGRP